VFNKSTESPSSHYTDNESRTVIAGVVSNCALNVVDSSLSSFCSSALTLAAVNKGVFPET